MASHTSALDGRPARSVQAIVKDAQAFDHSSTTGYSLTIILRTARNILSQVCSAMLICAMGLTHPGCQL